MSANDVFHCDELSNGLRVLYVPVPGVGTISTNLVYDTGSAVETQGERGIAHFVEHMSFKNNIWDMVTMYGANLNATTYLGRTNFISTFPASHIAMRDLLTREKSRMLMTDFSELATEANVVHNEFENSLNSAFMKAHMQLRLEAFMRHPTRWPTIGTTDDLMYDDGKPHNIDPERVSNFHKNWYHPKNATMVIVGQFKDLEKTKQQVSEIMGSIPSPENFKKKPFVSEPPQTGMRRFLMRGDQPILAMGFKGPPGLSTQAIALEIVNYLMNDGVNSPFDTLVKRGVAPSVMSNWERLKDANLFQIYASGNPQIAEAGIWQVLQQWRPTQQQFDGAKRAISKAWANEMIGSRDIAQSITEAIARGNPLDAWSRMRVLDGVTLQDVHDSMRYFNPVTVTVGMTVPIPKVELPKVTEYQGLRQDVPSPRNHVVKVRRRNTGNGTYFIRPDVGVHLRLYVPKATSLLASMLAKDTTSMSEHEFRTFMRGNGAAMGSSAEIYGGYTFTFDHPPPGDDMAEFKKAFGLFLDSIHEPAYEDFDKNKTLLQGRVGSQSLNTTMMASNTFYSMLMPTGMPSIQNTMSLIARSGISDVKLQHLEMFGQGCKITAFAPNEEVLDVLTQAFTDKPALQRQVFTAPKLTKLTKNVHIPNMASTTVVVGKMVDVGPKDELWMPLNVGVEILGHGFQDELMQIVRRQRGLTYGVNSHLTPLNDHQSLFQIVGTFAPEKLARGIQGIHDVIDGWKSSLTETMVLTKAREMDAEQLVMADDPKRILDAIHKRSIGAYYYDTAVGVELPHVQKALDVLNPTVDLLTVKAGTFDDARE